MIPQDHKSNMIEPNGEEKLIAGTMMFITNWIEYRFCDGALESTIYAMIVASQILPNIYWLNMNESKF